MNHWSGNKNKNLDKSSDESSDKADRVNPLGDVAPSKCPKCAHPMELAQAEEFLIIICQACEGLLIQSEVLALLVAQRRSKYKGPDSIPSPLDRRDLERRIACPGCGTVMDVHPYHGPGNAVIDSCSKCRLTFLDSGELSKIEKAPGQREI